MFLKLCKHEFKCTYRMFLIMYALLLLAAYSLASIFANQYGSPYALQWLVMYIIAIVATLIGTEILIMRSYYLSMYSNTGYLTNTLPVSESTLFLSKLCVYSLWTIVSGIMVFASVFIVMASIPGLSIHHMPNMFWFAIILSLMLQAILSTALIMTCINITHTSFIRNHRLFIAITIYLTLDLLKELCAGFLPSSVYFANDASLKAVSEVVALNQLATPLGLTLSIGTIVILICLSIYFMKHKMEIE